MTTRQGSAGTSSEHRAELPDLDLREAAGRPVGTRRRSPSRRRWLAATGLAVLGAVLVSHVVVDVSDVGDVADGELLRTSGLGLLAEFFAAAGSPRLDPEFLALTAEATLTTLGYAVLGTVGSLLIGLFGGVASAQTWWRPATARGTRLVGWAAARAALALPRGVHEVVWGLFFLSVLGLGPIAAVLAIAIPFGAVTAKVYSEILDDTGQAAYRALLAAGASKPAALAYGLLPPALPEFVSYGFYRFECAIRSAAVLGIIGAGGLGFQLQLSFQTLRYAEIWTLLFALIALCAGTDVWSSGVRARQAGARGPDRDRVLVGSLLAVAVLVPASAWYLGLDVSVLWSARTWEVTGQLLTDAWPPRLGTTGWIGFAELALVTVAMSVLAIALAAGGGMLAAFPAARLSRLLGRQRTRAGRLLRNAGLLATRALLVMLRAIPPPVWALLVLFVLSPGIVAGAVALGIYTLGVLGRLMAESVENLDPRPSRALRAQGARAVPVLCYAMLPAAMPRFAAYGLYRWEVTIRETVVVGVVGTGGLGLLLEEQLATFDYAGAAVTLGALIALTLLVDLTSAGMRRSLR